MTDTLHYRRGNYRVGWFGPDQRRDKGSISEEAYSQPLIVKPIGHRAIYHRAITFFARGPCASNCDFWAARIARANLCVHIYGKAMLAHASPHQIIIGHSAFPPPRQDAGAITAAVIEKLLLIKAFLPATDLTSDYMLHSTKHLPLAYFG